MSDVAPARKRRCTTLRKKDGKPCTAPACLGDVCWVHGGASLVGPCALTLEGGTPWVWPCNADGGVTGKPRVASKWAAVQFILRGVIVSGQFLVNDKDRRATAERFIRRAKRAGAGIISDQVTAFGALRRVRFAPAVQQ